MKELFPNYSSFFHPSILDGELYYYPNFLNRDKADIYFKTLLEKTPWQADKITVFGKTYDQPRLTSFHALSPKPYTYSNIAMQPHAMNPVLTELLEKIKQIKNHPFNAVLLNLYRHGQDSNGWHADNEIELGKNPIIASVSLGQERFFHLKHRKEKNQRLKIKLEHGSLLIMGGSMQHHWLHQIPKTSKSINKRINLTFRSIQ